MACETTPYTKKQTLSERKSQVKQVIATLDALLKKNRAKVAVDKRTGAVAFTGISDEEKGGVSDACAYRLLMATGSVLAKQAIVRAEQLAGRGVSRQALTTGVHSHDGGQTWDAGH